MDAYEEDGLNPRLADGIRVHSRTFAVLNLTLASLTSAGFYATVPAASMAIGRKSHWSDAMRRVFAAGAAALVFALGVFAASPILHKQLHNGDSALEEGCPIVLFATGVSLAVAVTAPLPPPAYPVDAVRPVAAEIFLDSPRYLLQPERGPPVA